MEEIKPRKNKIGVLLRGLRGGPLRVGLVVSPVRILCIRLLHGSPQYLWLTCWLVEENLENMNCIVMNEEKVLV